MKIRYQFILLFLLFLAYGAQADAWADDCTDCVERKQAMCAKECRLVAPAVSRTCQQDCVQQYCLHRCPASHEAVFFNSAQSCEDCLDQQFNLCDTNCPHGTDRVRAMCKLGCAKQRCEHACPKQPAKD